MQKFLTLLEGGIIGGALLIIFDHVIEKWRTRRTYYPRYSTYYSPTYKRYTRYGDEEEEK